MIDIPATERANNQPYGSFFKRHEQTPADPQSPQASPPAEPPSQAVKTVTNSDLAAFRQRRIKGEKAYEKRRLQLGLPTVAESRRRQAAEEVDFRAELRERALADKEEERYWRTRARELRTEIAVVNNQINYVQGRLNEVSETASTLGSWTSIYPIGPQYDPWGNGRRRGNRPPRNTQYPYGYPNQNPRGYPNQYPNGYPNQNPRMVIRTSIPMVIRTSILMVIRTSIPMVIRTSILMVIRTSIPMVIRTSILMVIRTRIPSGYPNQYPNGYPQYPYGYPTDPYDNSREAAARERDDLTYRLNDLLVRRAGLASQWQALEDEAREARVPQKWLLP